MRILRFGIAEMQEQSRNNARLKPHKVLCTRATILLVDELMHCRCNFDWSVLLLYGMGGTRNFSDRGLTLPMRGLKYCF